MRDNNSFAEEKGKRIFDSITKNYNSDWLLTLELYELAANRNVSIFNTILFERLETLKKERTEIAHLINSGMRLFN